MKNKLSGIFSPGLYLEGIRQSRYIGLPFLCFAILLELYSFISCSDDSTTVIILSLFSFCIAIPLCALSLFHFLNSRASSDFYHSIPRKRTTLYTSFAASAMTWAVGTVLLASLLHWFIGLAHGINSGIAMIQCSVVSVICCFLVLSACLLGMTLTGTLISQVATIGIILFLPRILILLVEETVCQLVPTLTDLSSYVGSLGSYRINMLFDSLSILLGSNSVYDTYSSGAAINITFSQMIYTIVLGLVYFLIGLWLFNARKSEKASYPATSPFIQSAVRVLIAFTMCLFAYNDLTNYLYSGESYFDISTMLLIFGFALIAYFLYEILSSRSIHSLRNSWKSLLIGLVAVVVLNAAMIGGTIAIANSARNYVPAEDKVESITITYPRSSSVVPTYLETRMSNIAFNDPETVHAAVEDMALCSQMMRNNQSMSEYCYHMNFNLKNGRQVQRKVFFNLPEFIKFNEMLAKNPEYSEAVDSLPGDSEISACYLNYNYDYSNASAEKGDTLQIWESLRSELAEMSYEERQLVNASSSNYISLAEEYDNNTNFTDTDIALSCYTLGNIYITGKYNGVPFSEEYNITPLTPKTAQLYMRHINTNNDEYGPVGNREALELFKEYAKNSNKKNYEIYLNVECGNLLDDFGNYIYIDPQEYSSYHYDDYNDGAADNYASAGLQGGNLVRLLDELIANYSNEPGSDRPIYRVTLDIQAQDGESINKTFYVNADRGYPILMEWYSAY